MQHLKSHSIGIVFLSLLGGVAGCVSPIGPAYVESTENDAARVTFISRSGGINLSVLSLSGPMQGCLCSSTPLEVIGIIHNRAILVQGSRDYADKGRDTDRVSTRVPSGKEFRFMIPAAQYQTNMMGSLWKTKTSYCQVHEGFVPEAGAQYEVIYDAGVNPCKIAAYKMLNGQYIQIITQKFPICLQPQNATATDWLSRKIREKCEERGS